MKYEAKRVNEVIDFEGREYVWRKELTASAHFPYVVFQQGMAHAVAAFPTSFLAEDYCQLRNEVNVVEAKQFLTDIVNHHEHINDRIRRPHEDSKTLGLAHGALRALGGE